MYKDIHYRPTLVDISIQLFATPLTLHVHHMHHYISVISNVMNTTCITTYVNWHV